MKDGAVSSILGMKFRHMRMEMPQSNNAVSAAGEAKVDEYVRRIRAGETGVLEGLPDVFRRSVEGKLNKDNEQLENESGEDEFERFTMKHGTTGGGEFIWYEYRNDKANRMKKSGAFEWGKERIYFDVSPEQFGQLRDLSMRVASEEKIPVGFKYLDIEETQRNNPLSIDGNETWFMVNFASREDAKRWYDALARTPEYASLRSGRSMDYEGIRIDRIAEYAPGFREARGSLGRMMKAVRLPGGLYEYENEDGEKRRLGTEDFDRMKQQYESLKRSLEEARRFWKKDAPREGS